MERRDSSEAAAAASSYVAHSVNPALLGDMVLCELKVKIHETIFNKTKMWGVLLVDREYT